MKHLLLNPENYIAKIKETKNYGFVIAMEILSAIIIAVSIFLLIISASAINPLALAPLVAAGYIVAGAIAGLTLIKGLYFGLLFGTVMKTLTGKDSGFYEGYSSISLAQLWMSYGLFLFAVLTILPIVGFFIGFLVFIFFIAKAMAVLFRALRELFDTDYRKVIMCFIVISLIGLVIAMVVGMILIVGLVFAALAIVEEISKSIPFGLLG